MHRQTWLMSSLTVDVWSVEVLQDCEKTTLLRWSDKYHVVTSALATYEVVVATALHDQFVDQPWTRQAGLDTSTDRHRETQGFAGSADHCLLCPSMV